jgi:tRNA_anti-like
VTRTAGRLAVGAFALLLLGCPTSSGPKPAPQTGPPTSVKAGDLLSEYGTNAVAADGKYKGKTLQVTGKFGSAQKNPFGGYVVQLLPEDAGDVNLSGVECFMAESAQADVATFQSGQIVTLQGTCDVQVVGQVKMSKCTVVK